MNEATFSEEIINEFDALWATETTCLQMIPGKEALSAVNTELQTQYQVSLTPTSIVDAMNIAEIPLEVKLLLSDLAEFSTQAPS